MADDDDDELFESAFENGHWEWDNVNEALAFIRELPPPQVEVMVKQTKIPAGAIVFRDDVDLIEQIRFRHRFQRKLMPRQTDVITLQDVKYIALYTAPVAILSPMLIDMLHLPTTERFLRALIFWSQYYLQVSEEIKQRTIELEFKVRTPFSTLAEKELCENLEDLRALVAKEYCVVLLSPIIMVLCSLDPSWCCRPAKKRRSLSEKDARLFETLTHICVQIIWLALGRVSFHQIELEVNRLFKTEIFNTAEHITKTYYLSKMTPEEYSVILEHCVRHDKKLNPRSPLINEVFCHREIDYRLMGLGVVKYPKMTTRQQYMWKAVAGKEEDLVKSKVPLGIIGMSRTQFDTMLKALPTLDAKSKVSQSHRSIVKSGSTTVKTKLYPDIVLPPKTPTDAFFPPSFPDAIERPLPISQVQRSRWQNRLAKLAGSKHAMN